MRFCTRSVLWVLLLLLCSCSREELNLAPAPGTNPQKAAEQILREVNRLRAGRKLQALENDPALSALALSYSRQMAESKHFDHADVNGKRLEDRLAKAGINNWSMAGENLAKTVNAQNPEGEATRGWQLSPGHSENLFNADYEYAGTGVYFKGSECYITQIYMKKQTGM